MKYRVTVAVVRWANDRLIHLWVATLRYPRLNKPIDRAVDAFGDWQWEHSLYWAVRS